MLIPVMRANQNVPKDVRVPHWKVIHFLGVLVITGHAWSLDNREETAGRHRGRGEEGGAGEELRWCTGRSASVLTAQLEGVRATDLWLWLHSVAKKVAPTRVYPSWPRLAQRPAPPGCPEASPLSCHRWAPRWASAWHPPLSLSLSADDVRNPWTLLSLPKEQHSKRHKTEVSSHEITCPQHTPHSPFSRLSNTLQAIWEANHWGNVSAIKEEV